MAEQKLIVSTGWCINPNVIFQLQELVQPQEEVVHEGFCWFAEDVEQKKHSKERCMVESFWVHDDSR